MAWASFVDGGYNYHREDKYVLFNADMTHEYLFQYVFKDLSQLHTLLERYVSKRIDVETFEMIGCGLDNKDGDEIICKLKSIHPYYEYEYMDVFIKAIGDYFNTALAHSKYRDRNPNGKTEAEWKQWYTERFSILTTPYMQSKETPDIFYSKYTRMTGYDVDESVEEVLIPIKPETKGFSHEIDTQEAIRRMLFWILDISVPSINKLTIPQRAWLYGNMFYFSFSEPELEVTTRISLKPSLLIQRGHEYNRDVELINEQYDLFNKLYDLSNRSVNYEKISKEIKKSLNAVADRALMVSTLGIYNEYKIANLHELLCLEILSMMQTNIEIKRCNHCGMYFIVTNRKIAYCNRTAEGESEPCTMAGPKKSFQKKMKEEPELEMYNRAYKTHHARRTKGSMETKDFDNWVVVAKSKLKEVRDGVLDISTFESWLKQ